MSSGNRSRSLGVLAVAIVALAAVAPASAGQIVYAHGGDLWAMNDNGNDRHPLVTAAQVGGKIGLSGSGNNGVSAQPNGTGVAFDAAVPAAGTLSCDGETHCDGLYSLVNGKLARLTAAAGNCETAINECGGEDEDPAVTSSGQVVYFSFFVDSTFSGCGIYYCGYAGGLIQQFYRVPLGGSQTPVAWPMPPEVNGDEDPYGFEPGFEGPLASDAADPTKIAYGGDYVRGLQLGHECGPQGESNCYPLDVEDSSGAYNQVGLDDSFYYGLAFSQHGSLIADIETGDNKGIWVYPSSQNAQANANAATANPRFTFALADPNDVSGSGQFDLTINGLTFVGDNEIVFSANNNLWSIPARCWATPIASTATPPYTSNCSFSHDATQLTHDGTSSAPDTQPSWTSSTAAIAAYGSGNNQRGKLSLTLKVSSSQKVLKQKALAGSVQCSEACGAAVAGGVRIKGSSKTLLTKTFSKVLSAGKTVKFSLSLSGKQLKAITHALQKHKTVTAQVVAIAKDAASHKATRSVTLTIKR